MNEWAVSGGGRRARLRSAWASLLAAAPPPQGRTGRSYPAAATRQPLHRGRVDGSRGGGAHLHILCTGQGIFQQAEVAPHAVPLPVHSQHLELLPHSREQGRLGTIRAGTMRVRRRTGQAACACGVAARQARMLAGGGRALCPAPSCNTNPLPQLPQLAGSTQSAQLAQRRGARLAWAWLSAASAPASAHCRRPTGATATQPASSPACVLSHGRK